LYSSVVLAGAFVWSRAPLRSRLVPAALAGAAYIVVQLPYLLHGFDVNRDRYVVEAGGGSLVGTAGRSPAEQILHALTPADTTGVLAFAAFAVVGLAVLAATRTRAALVLLLWIAVPIAFFSFVSAEETKFYDRYVIPQLPAALAAAAAGCAGLLRLGARAGPVVAVAAALALAGAEAREDVDRLRTLRALDLPGLVDEVRPFRPTGVLFRSAGRSTYTREPWLIGRTVWLELEGLRYEREKSCRDVRAFALGPEEPPRIGLWIFRGRPQRIEVALERLAPVNAVVSERVSDQLLLVRSARRETPRRLVELGNLTRRAWLLPERGDGGTRRLIKITGRALLAADRGVPCEEVDPPPAVPYGKAQSG
jgi:hypothetical protein